MHAYIEYAINDNNFILSQHGSLYWKEQKTLVIADMHLSRSGFLSQTGKAVPVPRFREQAQRLFTEVLFLKAEQLVILGEFSYRRNGREMDFFRKQRSVYSLLNIIVVNPLPDMLEDAWYDELHITRTPQLNQGQFSFCARPEDIKKTKLLRGIYSLCGGLHPAITQKGKGRQVKKYPCFYFRNEYGILPSYSRFTEPVPVSPQPDENVFALYEEGLVQVQ